MGLSQKKMMWPYHPDLLAGNIPRYTSYPTANEFRGSIGNAQLSDAIRQIGPSDKISLYIHIPYCQHICWYCGCNTGAAGKTQRLTAYLAALESEISLMARKLGSRGCVRHIAFGGGSPNAIAPVEFVRLVDRILTTFSCDQPDISVELDPRIFNAEWAATLAHCGVSRVSLGVQSLSEKIQRAIGRIQPVAMIENCISHLRDEGITAVNFDLMYGLPGQGEDDLQATLDSAIELAPSRIALFGYAHMPQMFPRQKRIDDVALPGPAQRFKLADIGYQLITGAGYDAIGFDHFARPDDSLALAAKQGMLHRNFQGFTDDDCMHMIGLGASAISCFPDYIIQNDKHPGSYRARALAQDFTAVRGIKRSANDKARGALIEKLLCTGSSGTVPTSILATVKPALEPFIQRKLARIDSDAIIIEAEGLPYARAIASALDSYRVQGGTRFSAAI